MKKTFIHFLFSLCVFSFAAAENRSEAKTAAGKPNLVIILAEVLKMSAFHGGTATPLIAHWPAGIAARGEFRRQPSHVIDLMPTLVELTAATYPETFREKPITPMAGRSLAPLFRADTETAPRDLFWEHMGNKAVRRGHWRAVQSDKEP